MGEEMKSFTTMIDSMAKHQPLFKLMEEAYETRKSFYPGTLNWIYWTQIWEITQHLETLSEFEE